MNLILENITRIFDLKRQSLYALNNFNLKINIDHGIYAFVGPNGSGKTTLFKIIAGLLFPSSGSIKMDDQKYEEKWIKKNISMILAGNRSLYQMNTVYENALYFSILKGIAPEKAKELIYEYSDMLNFYKYLNRKIVGLSSGERKKAAILSGLCTQCRLMLIDEPTWGLDIDAVLSLQQFLEQLNRQQKVTLFISSHDVNFISGISTGYIFMKDGMNKKFVNEFMDSEELIDIYKLICGGSS